MPTYELWEDAKGGPSWSSDCVSGASLLAIAESNDKIGRLLYRASASLNIFHFGCQYRRFICDIVRPNLERLFEKLQVPPSVASLATIHPRGGKLSAITP